LTARGQRFRALALFSGAAVAVHQLRYVLAFGGRSDEQLGLQSHSYLVLVLPVAAALVLLAVFAFAIALIDVRRAGAPAPALPRGHRLWARSTALLLGVYSLQEWIEGQVGHGHETGLGAVFGRRGWLAIPLALVLGAVVAWLLKGAQTAIEIVASRKRARRRGAGASAPAQRARPGQRPALDVVATFLASRGPPVTSS
jgi:hypothetical protein